MIFVFVCEEGIYICYNIWTILINRDLEAICNILVLECRVADPTVCPRSSDPFYIETYYINWVTTSWTYSKSVKIISMIFLSESGSYSKIGNLITLGHLFTSRCIGASKISFYIKENINVLSDNNQCAKYNCRSTELIYIYI